MKRYIKLYISFVKNCLAREMEFRLNFFIKLVIYFGWASLGFVSIYVIFNQVNSIMGWKREDMYILTAVSIFTNSFYKAIFHQNVNELPNLVRKGELDFALTKPLNDRFLLSLRYFNFDQMIRVIITFFLIIKLTLDFNPQISMISLILSFVLTIIGIVSMYSLTFAISCISFWRPRVWNLFALNQSMLNLSGRPGNVYKGMLRIFVTLLPITMLATIPTLFLRGKGSVNLVFYSIVILISSFIFSHLIYKRGLLIYESASS